MMFGRGERSLEQREPQVLGAEYDTEVAQLWAEFMSTGRSLDTVYHLWSDPEITNPCIRQRAVTVLTAPEGYMLPYASPSQAIGRFMQITERRDDGTQTRSLRERLADRPDLAQEAAAGVLFWLECTPDLCRNGNTGYSYQDAIRHLLPLVPEETADKLCSYYEINELQPFSDWEDSSGYGPAIELLHDTAVPNHCRESVARRWMDIARTEIEGSASPRESWELAIPRMALLLQSWSRQQRTDNDHIITAMVDFLEQTMPAEQAYVDTHYIGWLAGHVMDEDVRFRFAQRHMGNRRDNSDEPFQIIDDCDLELIQWMQTQSIARELDEPFAGHVEQLVIEYLERRAHAEAAQAAHDAQEAQLHVRLRQL